MERKIRDQFFRQFNAPPSVFTAPGRVNLVGEHTDYNEGLVLPGAVDKRIYVAIGENADQQVNLFANQYSEAVSFSLNNIQPVKGWATYLLGMIYQMKMMGHMMRGVNVVIDGDVPLGAGMSSSAAVCSAFGFALNEIFHLGLSRMEIALLGQKTEHDFAGVQCGIMDEYASLHGKAGHLMKLDCRSLECEYIPFDFPEYKIVLINSMVTHTLATTEYNLRRIQCEQGVEILKNFYPTIHSLRDVSMLQLESHRADFPVVIYKRCQFVIQENQRVIEAGEALRRHDIISFGKIMLDAHDGLTRYYQVSCRESDFLVSAAAAFDGVAGARQMGGGFGGCTINIVRSDKLTAFIEFMSEEYECQFHIAPQVYVTQIGDGAKQV